MIRIAGLWITMLGIGCLTPFEAQPQETPASVVARIGTDPEALARFVYEDISLEPVAGIMRTAETVLSHGGGGPAEREALLAEILALAGHEVRLLTAESSGESALARLATIGASQIIAQEVPAIQKIREEAIYVHDRLLAAVYEAGALPPLAETCACPPSEALTQHVWTEVRTDTGWRPLDPDLPAELVAAGRVVTAEALSHTVGLTLRLGYADGSEIEALSAEAPAKRLARDVVGLLQEASDGALRLILLLGDQVVESAPVPISTVSQPAGGLLGSSAGVFGGLSDLNTTIGGSDPDPEADPVRLILEWRLNGPGQSVSGRYLVWSTEAEGTHTDLSRALSTTLVDRT